MYSRLAHKLLLYRNSAAACLAEPLPRWSKFAASSASLGTEAFARLETVPLVDFLIRYFETQDRTWRDLYIGERIKQLHFSSDDIEQNVARRGRILTHDRESLCKLFAGKVDPVELEQLDLLLSDALRLATAATQEVHALFVGDCLLLHVASFCVTALLELGLTLRPMYESSKNPFDLRDSIQKLEATPFDIVCYSPYSYEFSLLMSQTFHLRSLGYSRRRLEDLAHSASDQGILTLELLADRFECPLSVQTTAQIRPYHDTWRSYATTVATRSPRCKVANIVNGILEWKISEYNKTSSRPLILVDERPLVPRFGERTLGQKLHDAIHYHPTVLSLHLSKLYSNLLASAKYLIRKKVVVTDLDNTLWQGLIGEGLIEHHHGRQQVLQRLRQKGVILAIASKNVPTSIRWDGALLSNDDFAIAQVNWENKPLNLKRIAAKLNLDLADFVFIDDSDEELEMVKLALPQVQTLSATAERTWEMLGWWASALPDQSNTDRTQLYRERERRQSYLVEAAVEQDRLLSSLNLSLTIREASSKDVPRVIELVNRTHQFNTNPQYLSPQMVSSWIGSPDHLILVGEAADKFGTMGLVSAMMVDVHETLLEINLWVLSCRVFGYGIETAMMNQLKRIAQAQNRTSIHARLLSNAQNGPCQKVYFENGFSWNGSIWVAGESNIPNPSWLSVSADDTMLN